MSALTWFGLVAVTGMLICYAYDRRSPWFVLAFAVTCAMGSIYGFLQGAWPFGVVEVVWSGVAVRRWWLERHTSKKNEEASHDVPIMCSLSDAELRTREATLVAEFNSAVTATEEIDDGYVFHIPGDSHWLTVVSKLMSAERECCRFLTFRMTAQSNMGPIALHISGPTGAKAMIKSLFTASL